MTSNLLFCSAAGNCDNMDMSTGGSNLASSQKALIEFECANKQIFRNLSLVLTDDQVPLLFKAVKAFPQDHISHSIDQHRRNSESKHLGQVQITLTV